MRKFKTFFSEEMIVESVPIKSSGMSADRHAKQYIEPYLPGGKKHGDETHEVAAEAKGLAVGDKVKLLSHHTVTDEKGKVTHHVTVQKKGSRAKITIPANKLNKPTASARRNRGFENEGALAARLNKHKLMEGGGAGATAGNDFHLIDMRGGKKKKIGGTTGEPEIQGEHKTDIKTTAFGQITVSRHPETGRWHIDDKARSNRPGFAAHVENATVTVDGKKKKLLDHLNETEPEGTVNKGGFYSDSTSSAPAHAYMRDHHVDVLHIDSHGTYTAGMSAEKDRHGLGFSPLTGEGKFRTRQKTDNPNKRTVQFSLTKLDKSNFDLNNDEHLGQLKKKLGHK